MGSPEKSPANANNSKQRVKVYRLNDDGKWDHQGTGHVSVDYTERSEELGLFVVDEEDNETLLLHRISSDVIYRKQEDITISWRDLEYSTELALSFQETTGCTYIWDNICHVQRNLHFNTLNNDSFHGVNSELRELPAVELSTLPLILKDTEKYEGLEYLGSGKFGEVWLVENKATKERFAMKRIEHGRKFEKYMAREIKIQKQLCYSNVIQFMELADLWSCGAILYAMLVGKNPNYRPNDTGETSNVYETNACPVSLPNSLSPKSKDLLARMLVA